MRRWLFNVFLISLSFETLAVVGEDDRFYTKDTRWESLFNGVFLIKELEGDRSCTAFLMEGDILITNAHCVSSLIGKGLRVDPQRFKDYTISSDGTFFQKGIFPFNFSLSQTHLIEDIFIGTDTKGCKQTDAFQLVSRDFAFIKLKQAIPHHIKRFKLLKKMDLENYEILGESPQRGWEVSTVGHAGDAKEKKMAHIGCRIRDAINSNGSFIYLTDCDAFDGQSGSPLFKILRHKNTGKVELGVLGVVEGGSSNRYGRRGFKNKRVLGFGMQYGSTLKITENSGFSLVTSFDDKVFNLFESFEKSSLKQERVHRFHENLREEILNMAEATNEEFEEFVISRLGKYLHKFQCGLLKNYRRLKEFVEYLILRENSLDDEKKKILKKILSFSKVESKDWPRVLSLEKRKHVHGAYMNDPEFLPSLELSRGENKRKANNLWKTYFLEFPKK